MSPALAVLEDLTTEDVCAEYARRHLLSFVETAWSILEAVPFRPNWHLSVLCDQLEHVTRGELKRLLVNVPPGTAKSLVTSVFWPAWEWASDPTKRFLTASYGQDLATRDALKMRQLVKSAWYQAHWPISFRDDVDQKTRYENEDGGWRLATSVGGRGTGEHPDRIIIDDPHNVKEAESDVERQVAIDWFAQTVSTRGVSRDAAIVVIMQRLHERDLSGAILSGATADEWTHVCLPMRAEAAHAVQPTLANRPAVDPRAPGALLWPTMFPEAKVASLERAMGSYATAGQLQQRPAPAEGGLLKRSWWKFYPGDAPRPTAIVISWDMALKDGQLNDYTVGQVWGGKGADRYFFRTVRDRWTFVEIKQQVKDLYRWAQERWPDVPITVLIEKAAAGPDVIAALSREIPGILAVKPKSDKVQRVQAVSPAIEAGNVFVPGAPSPDGQGCDSARTPFWVQTFLGECAAFPNGSHDDQVDACSQALLRFQSSVGKSHFANVGWA